MRATFFGIELGKRAILTQRTAMEVTSHNIANANTEGYARQRAVLQATDPYTLPGMVAPVTGYQVGTGVDVYKIESMRDMFIDERITQETSNLGYRGTANDLMKEVESVINELGGVGIGNQLDKFWAAWEDLSINPERLELRRNLVEQAVTLVNAFSDVDQRLRRLQGTPDYTYQGSIENQIEDTLKQVNNLAGLIADLNVKIQHSETDRSMANDLRDQRQKALEELADLINVDVCYDSKGQMTIRNGRHLLVDHSRTNPLYLNLKDGPDYTTVSGQENYIEFSDKPEVASAILTHTAEQRNITLTVSQLAQAHSQHSNLSFFPVTAPLSSFGVSSGSFFVNGRQFNLDAENTSMQGLSTMLNQAGVNLTARINEGGQLELKSAQTGTSFEIQARDGTSNLVTILNLKTDTAAQDARFTFNGQAFVSDKNVVEGALAGVVLKLNGTGVAQLDMRPTVTSGKLKGLLEVRDGQINDVRSKLDQMVYTLVTEVNAAHRLGFGLDGQTGINFFEPLVSADPNNPYRDAIKHLAISDAIKDNLNNIAASGGTFEGATDRLPTFNGQGDGSNAIRIAQIKHMNAFNNGKANFNDFYNAIVTAAAVESQRFEREATYSKDLMYQLDGMRQELSGVSLDEELTNIIKFQHAYNAAAKVITTVDSMLDKIINGMI
jgi:flagellar hook-associated protein 1